ncbi:MAG: protein kinase family protein [Bacilli bacterium]|nr:protein kinase family protein [Bacilli bacterium]
MASFTSLQLKELDKLLNYGGYTPLIASSNNEFEIFFNRLGIDIYKDYDAGSKGKTLYNFWVSSSNDLALEVIKEIREIILYEFANKNEERNKAEMLFNSIEKTLTNKFEINDNVFLTNKKYEIIKELTPGGFGDTYLIRDINLDKLFVLKKYRGEFIKEKDNKNFREKFLIEINILYDLNHRNIVRIYDYSNKENAWYIMEYVNGGNIEEYVKSQPHNLSKIFLQAINVFSFLENKNICHRDIRVNNILVTKEGILKIIDFGFGKIIENNGTLKSATRLVNYTFTLPKELNCDTPKYTKKTEIYFVGKLFEKLLADNNIENFPYKNIIKNMILEKPQDRIGSFLDIKNLIRDINGQYQIVPKNLKQNYQDLVSLLDKIIASKNTNSIMYDYDEIINNIEKLLDCNLLNDKLDDTKFFAECFISNLDKWYPKGKQISVSYVVDLLRWLKSLNDKQKEQFIKNLHFKLSSYEGMSRKVCK